MMTDTKRYQRPRYVFFLSSSFYFFSPYFHFVVARIIRIFLIFEIFLNNAAGK